MPRHVLKDAVVTINGVDLSDHVSAVAVEQSTPMIDVTSMGDDFVREIRGIPSAQITMSLWQDYDAGEVDATLWPLSQTDTPFPVHVRPSSGAISATNPAYQMAESFLPDYQPISGSVGEASATEIVFRNAGQLGIVRDVTP